MSRFCNFEDGKIQKIVHFALHKQLFRPSLCCFFLRVLNTVLILIAYLFRPSCMGSCLVDSLSLLITGEPFVEAICGFL